MAEDVCITDRVRIETPEPIEIREGSVTELSITTIALRLYPTMIRMVARRFDEPDFEIAARYAHEAARAFLLESIQQDEVFWKD